MIKQAKILCLICLGFIFNLNSANAVEEKSEQINKEKQIQNTPLQDFKEEETVVKPSRKIINNIAARVNGTNILQSDLHQQIISKSGESFNLQEAITEELFFQKAAERKLLPTESEVEKQIESLKIHNGLTNLTDAEFEEQLLAEGLSLKEYKRQMARMLAVEKLKHAEFNERVVVTSQQVEEYYKTNPEWSAEKYLLKVCDLPSDYVNEEGKLIKENDLKWEDLGWVMKVDMSVDLNFVSKMQKGEISKPKKINDQYQLVKLEDRTESKLRTLDERYLEIERTLHQQKKVTFEKVFEKELIENASIVYLV